MFQENDRGSTLVDQAILPLSHKRIAHGHLGGIQQVVPG